MKTHWENRKIAEIIPQNFLRIESNSAQYSMLTLLINVPTSVRQIQLCLNNIIMK